MLRNFSSESNDETLNIKSIEIPREYIETSFAKSSGPGGQNVNKTNSKAEIRFNLNNAFWLKEDVKQKIKDKYKGYTNKNGDFIITSQTSRSQHQNLEDAFEKLRYIIWECSLVEKERKYLIPPETEQLQRSRIDGKRKKSSVKKTRQGFDY